MVKNKADKISNAFIKIIRTKLKGRLKKVVLFGSHARDGFKEGSDYDFLVIVDKRERKVQEIILDACVEIMNRYIYITLVSQEV